VHVPARRALRSGKLISVAMWAVSTVEYGSMIRQMFSCSVSEPGVNTRPCARRDATAEALSLLQQHVVQRREVALDDLRR